ncbi:hypothetical protein A7A08_03141 [Methyloligella halotolerans]|uniref:DUF2946 domain-containing protein n=1 Tax=Methyloligella halotolerans TaxID=1177755 RepID=A0A1E2RUR9_9HYPH|nr:DUF2946 family protein [Methyloligella halotolerans]ODA65997.1 hypothetical protein A7A08_03141 [Methyloligella halotolerans]
MGALRGHNRRPIVHGMIATLVFYSVLLAWQVPAMALARALAPELTAQTTILCTESGPRVVALDADDNPVEDSHIPDHAKACPICQGVAGAVTPLAPQPPQIGISAVWVSVDFASEHDRGEGRSVLSRRGHDPPLSS